MNMNVLQLLAPLIGPVIVGLLKTFVLPAIPKPLLPVLATLIGAVAAAIGGADTGTALALGGSGVALREIVDQATKKGL